MRPLFAFVLSFYDNKIINNAVFRHRCDVYAAFFALDVVTALRQINREMVDAELNVGMSKPQKVASRPVGGLRGAVSAPSGYGAAPRSKKYVSKMLFNPWIHGFFITINRLV